MNNLSGFIQSLRERQGLTQKELAQAAGLSRGYINRLEHGQPVKRRCALGGLARALGCSYEELTQRAKARAELDSVILRAGAGAERLRQMPEG